MKLLQIVPILGCLFLQGCTIIDYQQSQSKIRDVKQLVSVGDNIDEARAKLVANGFNPTDVSFRTISKTSYSFSLRITKRTQLDSLGYAIDANLNAWRNGIPYHILFRSGLDRIINEIEVK